MPHSTEGMCCAHIPVEQMQASDQCTDLDEYKNHDRENLQTRYYLNEVCDFPLGFTEVLRLSIFGVLLSFCETFLQESALLPL